MTLNLVKAVIADDEAHLRSYLKKLLSQVWPELEICAEAGNGMEALEAVKRHKPQAAFLDIRMPGLSGLQAAEEIVKSCAVVFVTAYDAYAVEAFEKEAIDYLLKPVTTERLEQTVDRLKRRLEKGAALPPASMELVRVLAERLAPAVAPSFLQWLRVQHGDGIQLIAADEVMYFQAKDKYTAVITLSSEFLIRKSIRELVAELDPNCFCQVNRGTIVNLSRIAKVSRSITGRGVIRLKERPETLTVSRAYLDLFRQM